MSDTPLIQLHGWKVYSNRARSIMERSIQAAEDFIQTQHPSIRSFCHEQIQRTTLTYYDTYRGGGKPAVPEPEVDSPRVVRLVPRTFTNKLADKLLLARSIQEHNLFDYAPKSYLSIEEAIKVGGDPDRLLFIKQRSSTRGEKVFCVKHHELATLAPLATGNIIQEGINNPALFFNRKAVFRFYIFMFDRSVYISKHGVVIAHGQEYDPNTTDYKVHVQHNGEGAEPIKFPLAHLPYSHLWVEELKNLTRALLPVLEIIRRNTSLFRYSMFGVDAIPCVDNKVRLVEMNSYPNIISPPMVEAVYIPMFSSVMLMTVAGLNDNTWIKIS